MLSRDISVPWTRVHLLREPVFCNVTTRLSLAGCRNDAEREGALREQREQLIRSHEAQLRRMRRDHDDDLRRVRLDAR